LKDTFKATGAVARDCFKLIGTRQTQLAMSGAATKGQDSQLDGLCISRFDPPMRWAVFQKMHMHIAAQSAGPICNKRSSSSEHQLNGLLGILTFTCSAGVQATASHQRQQASEVDPVIAGSGRAGIFH